MTIIKLSSGVLAKLPFDVLSLPLVLYPNDQGMVYSFDLVLDYGDDEEAKALEALKNAIEASPSKFAYSSWFINLVQHRTEKVTCFIFCQLEEHIYENVLRIKETLDATISDLQEKIIHDTERLAHLKQQRGRIK